MPPTLYYCRINDDGRWGSWEEISQTKYRQMMGYTATHIQLAEVES